MKTRMLRGRLAASSSLAKFKPSQDDRKMTMMADPGGLHSPPNTVTCTPPRSIIRTPGTSKLQNKKRSPLALAEKFSDGGSTLKRQRGNMVESSRLQDITVNDIRSRSLKFLEQRDYNEKMKTLVSALLALSGVHSRFKVSRLNIITAMCSPSSFFCVLDISRETKERDGNSF